MFENFDPRWSDSRDRNGQDELDREIYRDSRERGDDPRDALLNDLDLPRGFERELVLDRDRVYELNGEDSRMLGAVGVFRVVPERDLGSRDDDALDCRNDSLEHLIDEGLVRTLSLDGHDRGVTLTDRGRDLLEANRRDRDDDRQQEFYAAVNRPRELSHDAQLYRAYQRRREEARRHPRVQRRGRRADRQVQDRMGYGCAESARSRASLEVVQLDGPHTGVPRGVPAHQPALARPPSRVRLTPGREERPTGTGSRPPRPCFHHHDRALRQPEAGEPPGRGGPPRARTDVRSGAARTGLTVNLSSFCQESGR